MCVRMRRRQALAVSGVAEGEIRLKFSVSENCSRYVKLNDASEPGGSERDLNSKNSKCALAKM